MGGLILVPHRARTSLEPPYVVILVESIDGASSGVIGRVDSAASMFCAMPDAVPGPQLNVTMLPNVDAVAVVVHWAVAARTSRP